jgi:glycosyltransferase involved in cell wall biosynthesis
MKHHVRILAGYVDRACGSHVYNQVLARRLAEHGHRVSLLCFRATPEVLECAEVCALQPEPFHEHTFTWRFASVLQHQQICRSMSSLGLPPADVVVGAEHLFLKGHHRLFPNTPWIYLPHSLVVSQDISGSGLSGLARLAADRLYRHLQLWALKHADVTMRFTRLACEALRNHYGPSIQPRFVINPMGIEIPDLQPRAPGNGSIRLLWVGQFIPRKRISLAIAALASLKHRDWRFDLVGDGPLRSALEEQVETAELADRVHFHGFQSEPARFYREADLLLFPSQSENSPVTMLESMSHGVPCLAMEADGVKFHNANADIIDSGEDGFLARSDEDFKIQLECLLAKPEELRAVGSAARQKMIDNHSWDDHIVRYEAVFEELTSTTAAGAAR